MLLDTAIHQAVGLHSIAPQRELRLLPVVSQPEGGPWLEMLWQLCWHLQRLGYPVVVLDATAQESHRSPGLAQLLGARPWPGAEALNDASDDGSLAVLPAAPLLSVRVTAGDPTSTKLIPVTEAQASSAASAIRAAPSDRRERS